MSGLKQANHQNRKRKRSDTDQDEQPMEVDQEQPPPPKKQKCDKCDQEKPPTKSLFSSQLSLMRLNVISPNQKPRKLWHNENANSIFGHQVHRTAYEKESKMYV